MQHPMVSTLSIAKLNRMPKDDFIAAIAPVFEELDDPWIAERAWAAAPFRDIESLHRAMIAVIDRACKQDQLELLARQPDLEHRKGGLYFRRFSPEQQEAARSINEGYKDKFGYPFLCFCKTSSATETLASMNRRLDNPSQLERITALAELSKITRERLDCLIEDQMPVVANAPAAVIQQQSIAAGR